MIFYILKSASCLALLLFFYHFILEREKMHNFNRFYLLIGVLVSLLIPFATITINAIPETITAIQTFEQPSIIEDASPIIIEKAINYASYLIGFYILISSILLIRFGRNLFKIIQKIRLNKQIKHQNANLILVDDKILPHTFWKAIFINKTDYEKGKIEEELFTHELTHVTQKHTIDVLLIELLQIIFWINPLFIFLKKAIQLNHEFIADSTVINQHKNTFHYQHLLLNKAAWNNEYYLASNLNYSLTKKRLEMMTTQSSQTKILLKKLAVIPLVIGFIFLFAERVEAQEIIETIYEQPESFQKNQDPLATILPNEEVIEIEEDKPSSESINFLASVERTENSIKLKCYNCYRWADLKLKLNTEYIINDFGFSEGKTLKRDKYAFTIKATKNEVIFTGLKNTAWIDLKFPLNKGSKQFLNQNGMISKNKQKDYLDAPVSTSKSSKQSVGNIQLKLKDVNKLREDKKGDNVPSFIKDTKTKSHSIKLQKNHSTSGFITIKRKKHFYVKNGKTFKFYNREGKLVNEDGK